MSFAEDFVVEVQTSYVSPQFVQIRASDEEIYKRMDNYIRLTREEINAANILEFCRVDPNSEPSECARINSVLQKRKDSKGHLHVSRVINTYSRDPASSAERRLIPSNGIEERLQNLETQLSVHAVAPKDIYSRLKAVEDRLLYLESVSPEYSHCWDKSTTTKRYPKKRVYSIADVDELIRKVEAELS